MVTFQSYFQSILKSARNPSALFSQVSKNSATTPSAILQQARNINTTQMVSMGVITAELLGFFTVGEMVGRMKLVGYRGETSSHH